MVPGHRYGLKVARLPKVGFVPDTDALAFGFLDPSLILRGCHLIPAFNEGRTSELLTAPLTAGRSPGEVDDWVSFYVNMCVYIFLLHLQYVDLITSFVDRDMVMRHIGGGVGHLVRSFTGDSNNEREGIMDIDEDGEEDFREENEDEDEFEEDWDEDASSDSESEAGDDDDDLGPEDGDVEDDDEDTYGSF